MHCCVARVSLLALAPLACAAALPAQATWARCYPTTSPPARTNHGLAYDSVRQQVMLYGGNLGSTIGNSNDTWVWSGTTWSTRPNGPPARSKHGMVFDSSRGVIVVFGGNGGYALNDTWEWNGTSWLQRTPVHQPPVRFSVTMAYDPQHQRTVLFGGMGNNVLNDLWEWDGTDWQQRTFIGGPSPRDQAGIAFEPLSQRMLLFGGTNANGTLLAETWLWDGTAWQQASPATSPAPRAQPAMTTDTARARAVLLGGAVVGLPTDAFAWEWDGVTWQQQFIASPTPRQGAGLAYDAAHRAVVLFSGMMLPDTWTYATALPASFLPYGSGCAGSAGTPALVPAPYELPWIGDTLHTQVTSLAPSSGGVFFVLGLAATLAVDLSPFGLPGCSSFVTDDVAVFAPAAGGAAEFAAPIPNVAALAGAQVFVQALALDDGAAAGAAVSNAGALVVGIR